MEGVLTPPKPLLQSRHTDILCSEEALKIGPRLFSTASQVYQTASKAKTACGGVLHVLPAHYPTAQSVDWLAGILHAAHHAWQLPCVAFYIMHSSELHPDAWRGVVEQAQLARGLPGIPVFTAFLALHDLPLTRPGAAGINTTELEAAALQTLQPMQLPMASVLLLNQYFMPTSSTRATNLAALSARAPATWCSAAAPGPVLLAWPAQAAIFQHWPYGMLQHANSSGWAQHAADARWCELGPSSSGDSIFLSQVYPSADKQLLVKHPLSHTTPWLSALSPSRVAVAVNNHVHYEILPGIVDAVLAAGAQPVVVARQRQEVQGILSLLQASLAPHEVQVFVSDRRSDSKYFVPSTIMPRAAVFTTYYFDSEWQLAPKHLPWPQFAIPHDVPPSPFTVEHTGGFDAQVPLMPCTAETLGHFSVTASSILPAHAYYPALPMNTSGTFRVAVIGAVKKDRRDYLLLAEALHILLQQHPELAIEVIILGRGDLPAEMAPLVQSGHVHHAAPASDAEFHTLARNCHAYMTLLSKVTQFDYLAGKFSSVILYALSYERTLLSWTPHMANLHTSIRVHARRAGLLPPSKLKLAWPSYEDSAADMAAVLATLAQEQPAARVARAEVLAKLTRTVRLANGARFATLLSSHVQHPPPQAAKPGVWETVTDWLFKIGDDLADD